MHQIQAGSYFTNHLIQSRHHLCNMAIDEDEKDIPQEEELVGETEAIDEEENKDMEHEEN